jgi:hypothetical protein
LQKLVIVVQFVMLMLDSLDPVENLEEGFLEDLCMPGKKRWKVNGKPCRERDMHQR